MIRVILEGLVKRFGKVNALDGATLDVRPGELTVVLGPGESGKTTLARAIVGLETLDEGEIYFDGRVMHDQPIARRKVGLVPQGSALWPHWSVAENVAHGLRLRGTARRERRTRVSEVMSAVGIDSLADQRPDSLSDLQRRRVALARALAIEPDLLVLDDPFHGLDGRARGEFRDEIRARAVEAEVTTLILTSDAADALAIADRLAVLDLGRIIQSGPPPEVYNQPLDAFVARLLGPANLIHGQIEALDARGDAVVRTPLGRLVGRCRLAAPPQGMPVTLCIRPEALGIGPVPTGANRFTATVERQVFLGTTRELHLRGPGDWPVVARALQTQSSGIREGQTLSVSVNPDAVVILPGKYAV
ncbi:MAG: ABC transporter ATP-binding protein [Isosphaeraceae bacterium]|nr:ABC transporter ATP-binding protein [Isosphaeraceae bacterium]